MRLPAFLEGIPQTAIVLGVPVIAFLVTVGISIGTGGGDKKDQAVVPTPVATIAAPTAIARAPTPVPPTPTSAPNRASCDAIRGTAYQSETERAWYQTNCQTATTSGSTSGSSGGSSTTAPPSTSSGSSSGAATGGGGGGGGHVTASEYYIGARLIIPSANVNASVTGADVGASGQMPDPAGYDNAVLYNFPLYPGLGGKNRVVAGHVDCGRCRNGGSGIAVFWYVRNLGAGDTAQWVNADGSVQNYVVVSSYDVSPNTDWAGIVASNAADMTLITCTGTFSGGEYNSRHVVQLRLV